MSSQATADFMYLTTFNAIAVVAGDNDDETDVIRIPLNIAPHKNSQMNLVDSFTILL